MTIDQLYYVHHILQATCVGGHQVCYPHKCRVRDKSVTNPEDKLCIWLASLLLFTYLQLTCVVYNWSCGYEAVWSLHWLPGVIWSSLLAGAWPNWSDLAKSLDHSFSSHGF